MQTNTIQILPDFIANQIAAGEVVQRPESVVKELVENSIDADATEIAVFVKDAGKTLIHIVDNGCGMSKYDLLLAPVRHATSKIHSAADLDAIRTFGFRGEAIPSIASVSLMEIKSATGNAQSGWRLISEPMKETICEEIAADKGTQIFVRNLFYNTPARKKFLKTDTTEYKYIFETMQRFAIAHNTLRFVFYNNDNLVFDVKPTDLKTRIATIERIDNVDEELLEVDYSNAGIHISGYIGKPQLAKRNNPTQYFFLNKRSINSKNLNYAVWTAFEHILEKGLKPFFVLNIEIDYSLVDVNVHPQKSEVKFEDENKVFSIVKRAILDALSLKKILPSSAAPQYNLTSYEQVRTSDSAGNENVVLVDKITGEVYEPKPTYSSNSYKTHFFRKPENPSYTHNPSTQQNVDALYSPMPFINPTISQTTNENLFDKSSIISTIVDTNLWQLHNKYIFIQTESGLLAIDQHNAHERSIYEKLVRQVKTGGTDKQMLLFPISAKLSSMQVITLKELQSYFKTTGFDFEIGNDSVTIYSQPCNLKISDVGNFFIHIIDDYLENEELKYIPSKQDKILATIACKAAIKAGQALSQEEMQKIVLDLIECEMPNVCPHGRPIIVESSLLEWDKKFGRI